MSTPRRRRRSESPDQQDLFAPPLRAQPATFEPVVLPSIQPPPQSQLEKKSVHIRHGDTGHTYENLFGEYLVGVTHITVEDPHISHRHQSENVLRFCELVVKVGSAKVIDLTTSYADEREKVEAVSNLKLIASSLIDRGIKLNLTFDGTLHDREIRLDNGWTIKIGRGFDIYQPPKSWFAIGAIDVSMRPCRQTKMEIFRR